MSDAQSHQQVAQPVEFRQELANRIPQFKAALPAQIPAERFVRVLMTAAQQNPRLLNERECSRRSFWNAAMRAAQDGLLPDGREGAIVPYRGQAQWLPMIAGLRKKVRNSGEIATWDVHVVHANDRFSYRLGDDPMIEHAPTLGDPGPVIAAYSIAVLKSGEKSREVMSIAAIHRIRDRSDAWRAFQANKISSTPWATDFEEMCRKTVARRHSKSLPMSTDLDDLIRRDDAVYHGDGKIDETQQQPQRTGLESRLDALAGIASSFNGDDDGDVKQIEHQEEPIQNVGATAEQAKRHRRTKAEMERDRLAEAQRVLEEKRKMDAATAETERQAGSQIEAAAMVFRPYGTSSSGISSTQSSPIGQQIDERIDEKTGMPNFLVRNGALKPVAWEEALVETLRPQVNAAEDITSLSELWNEKVNPALEKMSKDGYNRLLTLFDDRQLILSKDDQAPDDGGLNAEVR